MSDKLKWFLITQKTETFLFPTLSKTIGTSWFLAKVKVKYLEFWT
ncbi:hypothetical protein WALBB_1140001 [Wolbachia pipientis wAlbB]|nr:hypothetical protein WALBB_1140001 [Wolbachia pipientis wAlbB]